MKKMTLLIARYADSKDLKGLGYDNKVIEIIIQVAESYNLDEDAEIADDFIAYKNKFTYAVKNIDKNGHDVPESTFEQYIQEH